MLGYEPEEFPKDYAGWKALVHPDDFEPVDAAHSAHLNQGKDFWVEYRMRKKSGDWCWVRSRGTVVERDADGRPIRMVGTHLDVTPRKEAEEALRGFSRQLINAQEQERSRLARELHDDVTQRLACLAIDVGRIEHASSHAAMEETMRGVRKELVRLSDDIHGLAYRLHPSVLEDLGLAEALKVEADRFARHQATAVEVKFNDIPASVPPDAALCLFRVAQEALRNVGRHAQARALEVWLRELDGGLQLAVRDDGRGFDPALAAGRISLGLAGMRERVRLLGGHLDIESAPGHGTTIVAWVPLRKKG
jgi:PAS domain S-box-containing protein